MIRKDGQISSSSVKTEEKYKKILQRNGGKCDHTDGEREISENCVNVGTVQNVL
jgi:hypothetical protein